MKRTRRPFLEQLRADGFFPRLRRERRRRDRLDRSARSGDVNVTKVISTGAGAPRAHDDALHENVIGEVPFQAILTLDDTATGSDKGRWKVSLPAGAGTVTIFKHRAVVGDDCNYTTHGTAMVFDVNLNGASKGTVTIPSSTASGDSDVTDYTLSDGDRVTIDKDSGPDEGDVHQVILIGKQELLGSIDS